MTRPNDTIRTLTLKTGYADDMKLHPVIQELEERVTFLEDLVIQIGNRLEEKSEFLEDVADSAEAAYAASLDALPPRGESEITLYVNAPMTSPYEMAQYINRELGNGRI